MKHIVNSLEAQKKKKWQKNICRKMEQKWNENENENKKWIKEMKTVLRDKIKYQYFINIKNG